MNGTVLLMVTGDYDRVKLTCQQLDLSLDSYMIGEAESPVHNPSVEVHQFLSRKRGGFCDSLNY